jgi:hypothetical protein
VFEDAQSLEATLPGGGTLKIAASGVPGEFLQWCRARGQGPAVVAPGPRDAAKPAA